MKKRKQREAEAYPLPDELPPQDEQYREYVDEDALEIDDPYFGGELPPDAGYAQTPPAPSGYSSAHPGDTHVGYPPLGYPQSAAQGGYPDAGYPQSAAQGGYPDAGYPQSAEQGGYPDADYPQSAAQGGYPDTGYPAMDGYAQQEEMPMDAADGAYHVDGEGELPSYSGDDFDEEELYEDDPEAEAEQRFHIAMSVLDVGSVILGCVCIIALAALLISLFSWLKSDISRSLSMFQSTLQ